jgi:hypothetical protein
MKMREVIKNDKMKTILSTMSIEVGAVNANVLHTLLHAMLRQLNIVDVQADLNDIDRDVLSAPKARELSVLSDVDGGRGDFWRSYG